MCVLTVNTGCLGPHKVSAPSAIQCSDGRLLSGLGCCSFGSSTFDLQSKLPRKTSSSSCHGSPLRKKQILLVLSSLIIWFSDVEHQILSLTWLLSDHRSYLTGSPWSSRAANTATLRARQQRLAVVLAGLTVTGMLLCQVLLRGPFQVELLQTCTLHLFHQLIQWAQLEKASDTMI